MNQSHLKTLSRKHARGCDRLSGQLHAAVGIWSLMRRVRIVGNRKRCLRNHYVDLRSKAGAWGARLSPFWDAFARATLASLFSSFLTIVHSTIALIFQLYDTTSPRTPASKILELDHQFCDRTNQSLSSRISAEPRLSNHRTSLLHRGLRSWPLLHTI